MLTVIVVISRGFYCPPGVKMLPNKFLRLLYPVAIHLCFHIRTLTMLKIFLVVSCLSVYVDSSTNWSNNIYFSRMGKTTKESSYSHLVAPLPLSELVAATKDMYDLCDAVANLSPSSSKILTIERYGISRIVERIELITDLAQSNGLKDEDTVIDLGNNTIEWAVRNMPRYKRSATTLTASVLGLAAFGTSLFTQQQLNAITSNLNRFNLNVSQLKSNAFRIFNLTKHVELQHHRILTELIHIDKITQAIAITNYENQIGLMLQNFRFELNDFLSGLIQLTEGRLSPFLIEPQYLVRAYDQVIHNARRQNLHPISEDTGILFQAPVSMSKTPSGLSIIVHVPLYDGNLLDIYRYQSTPLVLGNGSLALTVNPHAAYLALDPHHTAGKELTADQFNKCTRYARYYHCRDTNVLLKDLSTSCVYNLFMQNMENVHTYCHLQVTTQTQFAIQLNNTSFKLVTTDPTRLTYECSRANKVSTIKGVAIVTLTDECPKASTPSLYLVKTTNLFTHSPILTIPMHHKATQWLQFNVPNRTLLLQSLAKSQVSSKALRQIQLELDSDNDPWTQYHTMETHVQSGIMYVGLVIMLILFIRKIKCICKQKFTPEPPIREIAPGVRYPSQLLLPPDQNEVRLDNLGPLALTLNPAS